MSYQTLIVSTKDNVTLIQLHRPQQLNALNSLVLQEIYAALFDVDHDETVRCSVITGNEKAFAAGADIKEMADKTDKQMEIDDQFAPFDHIRKFKKPIIAAVSGFALGGGCELVMACDMIIAAENAKFGSGCDTRNGGIAAVDQDCRKIQSDGIDAHRGDLLRRRGIEDGTGQQSRPERILTRRSNVPRRKDCLQTSARSAGGEIGRAEVV